MTPQAPTSVGDLLDESTRRLEASGIPQARLEAAALVAHVLGTDRGGVLARRPDAVDPASSRRLRDLVAGRAERRPLQYLTGRAEFHGLEFAVGPGVLIPRPETEGLVDAVLGAALAEDARVADLGTGSGCIAVTLAVLRPGWRVTAVDRSAEALAVAGRNVAHHGVGERVRLVEAAFETFSGGPFDAIVSNPPYIPEAEWLGLAPEVRDYEPKGALVPGPRGLEAYEELARAAFDRLAPGGLLALELGWTSERGVRTIVGGAGFREVAVAPDLAGIPRVLTARR